MKKIVAILLALALCLSTAFAGEANWADVADTAAQMDPNGKFWTLNAVNCTLWIPEMLQYVELTQDDIDAGYTAYWCTEDGSAALGVQYIDVDGMSLTDYAAELVEMGIEKVQEEMVNGIPCVTYTYTDEDGVTCNVVAITTEAGYVLEFAFTAGDESYEQLSLIIAASIQPAQ